MLSKLVQSTTTLAFLFSLGYCDLNVQDMGPEDSPEEMMAAYDYSVISFFKPSDPSSAAVNAIMEGAKLKMDSFVAEESMNPRNVGWFRVDIDKYPEMALTEEARPDQMVTGQGWRRMIGYQLNRSTVEEDEKFFAQIVYELSGDWYEEVSCDQINADDRVTFDEVVYLGEKEALEKGQEAEVFTQLSQADRYNFNDQRARFLVNFDPACREDNDVDKDKNHIIFMTGTINDEVITLSEVKPELNQMLFTLNTQMVKGTPRWGQRAFSSIFDYRQNAIMYMLPELRTAEDVSGDWRVSLMVKINEWIQQNNSLFIPIVWSWSSDQSEYLQVPKLAEIMEIKFEDLPQIYLFSGIADKVIEYPEPLVLEEVSPELILIWAKYEILENELVAYQGALDDAGKDGTEEIAQEKKDALQKHIDDKRPELAQLKLAYKQLKNELKEGNHFATKVAAEVAAVHKQSETATETVAETKSESSTPQQDEL